MTIPSGMTYIPIEDLAKPKVNHRLITDRWWQTYEGFAIFHRGVPLCLPAQHRQEELIDAHVVSVFIPIAYVPVIEDQTHDDEYKRLTRSAVRPRPARGVLAE